MTYAERWDSLLTFLETNFGLIDSEGLAVILSVYLAQFWQDTMPIFLELIDPPIDGWLVSALSRLHQCSTVRYFTPLAIRQLLPDTKRPIWLMNSMQDLYSARSRNVFQAANILLGLYTRALDTQFRYKAYGYPQKLTSDAKITLILVTRNIKIRDIPSAYMNRFRKFWRVIQTEFIQLRWRHNPDTIASTLTSLPARPAALLAETADRLRYMLDLQFRNVPTPTLPDSVLNELRYLACAAAYLQLTPTRANEWSRILRQVATAHANLFGLTTAGPEQVKLCRRIVVDSVPETALSLCEAIHQHHQLTAEDIEKHLPHSNPKAIKSTLRDLHNAEILIREKVTIGHGYRLYFSLAPDFQQIMMAWQK